LEGIEHERQGWNNCGPTTLAMGLSYWGSDKDQSDIAPLLKPDPEDKHVGIHQMEGYAREQGLATVIRVGGSLEQLKALLRARFPVIVESWYVRDAQDQLGHYRLVAGYNDAQQHFHMYDSLYDPPTTMGYQELDELWRVFNRTYLVVYPPARWEELKAILEIQEPPAPSKMPELVGPELEDPAMYEEALRTARMELANPPASCVAYADCADWAAFSWFNVGTNLTALGRYEEAAAAYDQARAMGLHYRMLWYQFGPYEAYFAAGRYDDVIALANSTLNTAKNLEESYYWRGKARLAQGDRQGARADFESALRYHPAWEPATMALSAMDDAS
jgi:tetratricopeptide (TPR) repeat protein